MDESLVMQQAQKIIDGSVPPINKVREVVKALKKEHSFGMGRKVLEQAALAYPDDVWCKQQLALCTYKDEELLPRKRFADALTILEGIGLRNPSAICAETLGLGGAVYKWMWEYGGQLEHLYEALSFYRAAYKLYPEADRGYGGINAAFILQILAARTRAAATRSNTPPTEAEKLETDAAALRREIVTQLANDPASKNDMWVAVTLAEAFFGLREYQEAGTWLTRFLHLRPDEWELQTAFRQLVAIARMQGVELPPDGTLQQEWHDAWRALANLLKDETEPALSCYRGKVGLALSGGGFRASLYHLGVLARLAEMDVLRSVEVLSTVSGGSIVGAHYYLEVKKLLKTKEDRLIARDDYIAIVENLLQHFLKGVQANIRMRALANLGKNIRMIFSRSYGRSHRLGELYEDLLYSKVDDGHPRGTPRLMRNLLIKPAGHQKNKDFKPKFSNWRRRARVPVLLLNATSLNTGHNWQFTARSMGEPPGLIGDEVDKNSRYRRLWYDQAPTDDLKNYRLGHAVAASACVPGLFDPLTLSGLYEDKVVRLVDGGVHDNQGVAGLLDEGCTMVLCSDASGQMDDKDKPADSIPAVLLRSNSIVMSRVRQAEYQNLRSMLDSHALQGLFFIHLKKDLKVPLEDWVKCQDPTPEKLKQDPPSPYGIAPEIQRLMAGIRTDLDSFTEVEAYALMCSGYLMTEQQFRKLQEEYLSNGESGTWGGYDIDAERRMWPFLKLAPLLTGSSGSEEARNDLQLQLKVGAQLAFKIWRLNLVLRGISWALGAAAVIGIVRYLSATWSNPLPLPSTTVGGLVLTLTFTLAAFIIPIAKWISPERAMRGYVRKAAIALFGFVVANLHLWPFNGMFVKRGKLERLLGKAGRRGAGGSLLE